MFGRHGYEAGCDYSDRGRLMTQLMKQEFAMISMGTWLAAICLQTAIVAIPIKQTADLC